MSRVRSVRAWGPSTGSTACALAGRRCSLWSWRKGVPGGGAFHHCEGRLRSGAVPPLTARPLGGLLGSATHVLWARVCQCRGPTLSPWPACPACGGCVPRGWWGAVQGGAGVPPLWRAPGVRRCPSPSRPSSGVGSQGSATCVSRVRSVRAWGPSTGPTACALAGRRCSLWGWRRGVPGGGAFHHCEGRLKSGAVAPPTARQLGGLLGSATHVLWVWVCGCGCPTMSLWPACPVGAACRRGGGGPSPGGLACHRCKGRLVSGAVPPPAARPLERAARVSRPVCPGCGRCGRGDPAPAPRRAPMRAVVACREAGGRASPGGLPSTVVRGVWGQTLPLPRLPALWAGCPGSLTTCCGRGCGCVRCVWCLCGVCRGARCRPSLVLLVLPSLVSRCGAVLAVCLRCPLPCARPLLGCWLPPVSFVASLLFTLSSTLLPGMHFFPASALVRVSVFFLAGLSFSLVGPPLLDLRRERMQTGVRRRGFCRTMAPCYCHTRLVSYSCGGVVCYLFMLRLCAPLSYFLPCCACYGVF